jgi:thymidylate kinase
MFTVALIGPDGAGKTTISEHLMESLPWKVKYLYMGVNADSSNRVLPTTAVIRAIKRACGVKPDVGGPPSLEMAKAKPQGFLRSAKSLLSLANRLCEESYRQVLTWWYELRGHVVLYDRHYFIDYFAYDIAPCKWRRPLARRLHGFWLNRIFPKPDLIVYLDAPSEVLFARKGEGTIEALERRRNEYLELRDHLEHFAVIDVNRPLDVVTQEVTEVIVDFHRSRNTSTRATTPPQSTKLEMAHATTREPKS